MVPKALIASVLGATIPASALASIAVAGMVWGGTRSTSFALDGLGEATVHEYHFVESHQDLAAGVPCYCGCHGLGHRSLLDCYIRPDGRYERHASGCAVCGMETNDIDRMLGEGMDTRSIRTAIDAAYSSYGRPTGTP